MTLKRFVKWFIAPVLLAIPLSYAATSDNKLTIIDFEKSALIKKYKIAFKDSWNLKTGGMNYAYRLNNPDVSGESIGIEMQFKATDIRRIDISWPGDLPVNRLDDHEAEFLRRVAVLFSPSADIKGIITYVRAQAARQYAGGSDEIPRKTIGALKVYAGQNGSLIVVLEK